MSTEPDELLPPPAELGPFDDEQVTVTCDHCAVQFRVPAPLQWRQLRVGRSIWCPNGHLLGADHTEPVSSLLQRAQDIAAELHTELWLERNAHLRTRRDLLDTRHRLMGGRCPECNELSLKTLSKHMRNAHPTFDSEDM